MSRQDSLYTLKRFPRCAPKEYLAGEKRIVGGYEEYPLASKHGIISRDRYDVMRCDMVLFNFIGTTRVSIGSVMEIGWGDAWRKPMVIAMETGNVHDHAMIREAAGFVVPTLDEAIEIVIAVLTPGI